MISISISTGKISFLLLLFSFAFVCTVEAQRDYEWERRQREAREARASGKDEDRKDVFTFGIGAGNDFGGLGGNLTVYPQKNIGLFFGGGYAIAGFGYNAGIKIRILPKDSQVDPFFMAMYGYNAAIYISNETQLNKMFYGPTVGAGIDAHSRNRSAPGYWSFALLVPIRNSDPQHYIDYLKANGVTFSRSLLPISFSVGYKFILQ